MFVCLKCDSNNISGYMKVLEDELSIMLMLDYNIFQKNIEIAIAERENNIVVAVPIDEIVLTECEKGVRLKISSKYINNLKGNSNFIIVFKIDEDILKMVDENIFEKYNSKKMINFINFLDFKKLYLNKKDNIDTIENIVLDETINIKLEETEDKAEYSNISIEDDLSKECVLYEPEVVCDSNSTSNLKEINVFPKINSFFKDKTTSLDISLKRAFINTILSFLSIYNSNSNIKNTFIFTKENKKEIEFIKIKMKDIEDTDNIFLILIQSMINELNFANIATHIYLGIEKDSKESIAILLALSKDAFKTIEDVICQSDIRVLETGLNDEFHYIIYECLI